VKIGFRGVLMLVFVILLSGCEREKKEQQEYVEGYRGEADRNPYLASERYLEKAGHEVRSMKGVVKLNEEESVVFSPASSLRSTSDGERVLSWISEGGHYICFLQRGEDFWQDVGRWSDHDPREWEAQFDETNGLDVLLDGVGLKLVDLKNTKTGHDHSDSLLEAFSDEAEAGEMLPNSEVVKVKFDGRELELELGGTKGVASVYDDVYGDWDDGGAEVGEPVRFASRGYGIGRITVISDARLFRNPYLKMSDHAEMLDLLVDGGDGGKVVFSLGKVRSFMSMLTEYAWMALLGLLVMTALWLWKNLPKYGPTLDVVDGHFRDSSKQMLAVGHFFWGQKRDDLVLQPLRNEVVRKAGANGPDGYIEDGLIERLVEISGIGLEEVQEAMTKTSVKDSSVMVRIARNLQHIIKTL